VLTRQCLDRRIAGQHTVASEVHAWANRRNAIQAGVDWHFTTEDARTKLNSLYPNIKT
jgi:hypothetical protein